MEKRIARPLQGLLLLIPVLFVIGSIVSNCSSSGDPCSGSVDTTDAQACSDYAAANGCNLSSFDNGVCDVTDCDNCEIIVDDLDPVIDVDDGDF